MQLDRRRLLIGSAIGGGLLVGWALLGPGEGPTLAVGAGELGLAGWLRIGRDGVVSVAVPGLEMGQGLSTLLAQIAAQELGADWRRVALAPVPPAAPYANGPLAAHWAELWLPGFRGELAADSRLAAFHARAHRMVVTAAGTALEAWEPPLRAAAATARALLAKAAAARWGVDWQACEVAGGMVRHGGQALPFAKLVGEAARLSPPDPAPLRAQPPGEGPGAARTQFPRLDLPAQVDGSLQFAADIRLPGMVFAAIRHAPPGAASLAGHDGAAARTVPGFIRLVEGPDWLAAVASNSWAAERALAAVAPHFRVAHPLDSLKIEAALDAALKQGKGTVLTSAGDPEGVLGGTLSLSQRYDAAPATHAMLECASATVRLRDGRAELWLAAQAPEAARAAVADALGMARADVILYPVPAGGSFERRLDHAHAVEAALIAKAVGKPVQLMWSRWQEAVAGLPRAPVAAQLSARLAPSGELFGWKARLATPAAMHQLGRRLGGASPGKALAASAGESDTLAMAGAVPPYAIAHLSVEQVPADIALPVGPMRGGAHGITAFFTECFLDELAAAGRHEPLSFRMSLLGDDPRLAQCLQRVSTLGGWNGGGDGSGQGIACHRIGTPRAGGCIAAVAIARRDERGVRVERISVVADIGRIINRDIARQQIEGGLIFGIGLAIGSALTYVGGLPADGRLAAMGLPLLADCPEIVVEFIESPAPAFDPGDLAVAVAAPVIANALYSATGLRFRKLPLVADE